MAIPVKDLRRATEFYRTKLGVKLLFTVPNLSFFDCSGVTLMLDVPEKDELRHRSSIVYFGVEDIQVAHRVLAERGVRFEGAPHVVARLEEHDVWMAFFRDSEENLHALTSEEAKSVA